MTQERKQELINLLRTIQSCTQTVPDYGDPESVIDCWNLAFEWLDESQQPIPQDIENWIEDEAKKEEIYEPKYGGKDHSGYDTMMLYEVNYHRSECFSKGATAMYQLLLPELQRLREENEKAFIEKHTALVMQKQKTGVQWLEQAAEIESLKADRDEMRAWNFSLVKDNQELKAENERYEAFVKQMWQSFGNFCKAITQ